ncbi:UPF0739 protein C1orf74 homolog [Betta splendens]|uniref:UPF0739 protein C1orf74 homolog n=1 Tax=Betta splendens TaxID=158456 RepID=A0A6P7MM34_BETSP|nr:UPF0739 protein C1orf74 homolog [Betta splendens]
MSAQELFVSTAHKCLSVGRKSPPVSQGVDLAVQVLAVDLGLKPALLYDSNGASSEQVHHYLSSLQSYQLVSKSLLTLDLNGNTLIFNPGTVVSNLERVLCDNSVAVVDVCHSLEKPVITEQLTAELRSITEDLLLLLKGSENLRETCSKPLSAGEKCDQWNLCTVFGLLLGFPVTYWFDQNKSFENCLSMTPLVVTTAAATWQPDVTSHRCCLYSFSIPEVLREQTHSTLEHWRLCLQDKFHQQNVLKDLTVGQTAVTLPSVCL